MACLREPKSVFTSAWIVVVFVVGDGLVPFFLLDDAVEAPSFFFLCDDIGDIGIVDVVDGRASFFSFDSFFLESTFVLLDAAFSFPSE